MSLVLVAAVLAFNLLVFGAHARLPFRLAGGEERSRRAWALAAPPALLASLLLTGAALARQPDAALAWGMTGPLAASMPARLIALVMLALLLADVVVAVGWRRLEPAGWRILGALGLLGAMAHAFGAELLRVGWGPVAGLVLLLAAAALRLPLALAAAELAAGPPGRASLAAGPALALAFLLWPETLRRTLRPELATLAAAVLLLVAARWTPAKLRRATAVAGLLLAVFFLARAADLSASLGQRETLPASLLIR